MDFCIYSCFLLGELGEPLVVPVCVLSDLPLLHLLDPLLHLHLVHESRKRKHSLLTVRYFNNRYFNIESFRQKKLKSKTICLELKVHIKQVRGNGYPAENDF